MVISLAARVSQAPVVVSQGQPRHTPLARETTLKVGPDAKKIGKGSIS